MVGTSWDQTLPSAASPKWLWHVLPGFLGSEASVTVFRATEATFLESYRRFGFPTNHPSRLENHAGVGGGTDWSIFLINTSPLAVPRYALRNARGDLAADPTNDRVILASAGPDPNGAKAWFLVPRTGLAGRGWDVVHAASGKRLIATPDGRGLALSALLHPNDHWDVAQVRPNRTHRSHFWLPTFFRDAFRERLTEEPYPVNGLAAVIGTQVTQSGNLARQSMRRTEALARAAQDSTVAFMSYDSEGTAVFYQSGNSLDVQRSGGGADGPAGERERERRAYQDTVRRGPAGTNEFPLRSYVTFYARQPSGDAANAYADCLARLGMDAPSCDRLLEARFPAEAERHATARRVLGTPPGQVRPGLCSGDRIGSALCQRVCSDLRSMQSRICEQPLRSHCAAQTTPGCHDPMCACWLSEDAYRTAQVTSLQRSGIDSASPLYAAISEAMRNTSQPVCAYRPCLAASLRPDFKCPNTTTMLRRHLSIT